MGTDIHGIWQVKRDDGSWEDVPTEWPQIRNYPLFAMLSGDRDSFGMTSIHKDQRGLPDDFEMIYTGGLDAHPVKMLSCIDPNMRENYEPGGFLTDDSGKLYFWMGDHGHSYVYLNEIRDWWRHRKERQGSCDIHQLRWGVVPFMSEAERIAEEHETEQVCFVYGYDS